MPLPPLYKYMGVQGAKLTLSNRTFRHAKPSTFNDIEDMTVQGLFPLDVETAVAQIVRCFDEVLLRHLNDPPTCPLGLRESILQIQRVYRESPSTRDALIAELGNDRARDIYDMTAMRRLAEEAVTMINAHFQTYRVLCVTTENRSEKMWKEYAENHSGVALRIEPNLAKDSKFRLFRPVTYCEKRPPLYDNVAEFVEGALFGDQAARAKEEVEKIIYAKTSCWSDEREYRLAVPLEDEEEYAMIPYHPEEISEIYLGSAMRLADMADIVSRARLLNPAIVVFQVERAEGTGLTFRRM